MLGDVLRDIKRFLFLPGFLRAAIQEGYSTEEATVFLKI